MGKSPRLETPETTHIQRSQDPVDRQLLVGLTLWRAVIGVCTVSVCSVCTVQRKVSDIYIVHRFVDVLEIRLLTLCKIPHRSYKLALVRMQNVIVIVCCITL